MKQNAQLNKYKEMADIADFSPYKIWCKLKNKYLILFEMDLFGSAHACGGRQKGLKSKI